MKSTYTETSEVAMKLAFAILLGHYYNAQKEFEQDGPNFGIFPQYTEVAALTEYKLESHTLSKLYSGTYFERRTAVFVLKNSSQKKAVIKLTVGSDFLDGEKASGWTATTLQSGYIRFIEKGEEKKIEKIIISDYEIKDVVFRTSNQEIFDKHVRSGIGKLIGGSVYHTFMFYKTDYSG